VNETWSTAVTLPYLMTSCETERPTLVDVFNAELTTQQYAK
jgi:hypothetical protein